MGVEEHRGEGRVGVRPSEEEQGLGPARGEVERGGAEAPGRGVGEEEGGGAGVVGGRVRRADAEVLLEAGDLVGLELGEGVGGAGETGEEGDDGEQEAAVAERRHRVLSFVECGLLVCSDDSHRSIGASGEV